MKYGIGHHGYDDDDDDNDVSDDSDDSSWRPLGNHFVCVCIVLRCDESLICF